MFHLNADDENERINVLLDGLHQDAHEGNLKNYFNRYSADAVFWELIKLRGGLLKSLKPMLSQLF